MNELGQGLSLSGIGILITFSALGTLILLIIVLKALFPVSGDELDASHPDDTQLSVLDPGREEIKKKAAAAGVAILLSKRSFTKKGGLGSELEKPVSKWWQRGLDQIHGKEKL